MSPDRRPSPPVLVIDGDCGICTRLAGVAERWVPMPGGSVVAAQRVELAFYGLTAQQCDDALQLVARDGRVHAAQDAVARLLLSSRLWWRPLGLLLLLPGINALAGVAYRWVARNRHRLPAGTPACAMPPPPALAPVQPGGAQSPWP